jgi:Recombinase/Recombinase zinc beta ribbon domain
MVQRYLAGDSLPDLCRWLDSEGVKPRHGGKWWPTGVRYILGNASLIGRRKDKHGNTILRFEPILDMATWDRLQAKLAGNPRHRALADEPSLLTGVIYCGLCHRVMHRKPVYTKLKDGSKTYHWYYRCDGTPRERSTCKNMVRIDWSDENVDLWVREVIGNLTLVERIVLPGNGHDDDVQDIKNTIRNLDPEADDYDLRLSRLRSELARVKALPAEPPRVVERETGLKVRDYWAKADAASRRRFLLAGKVRVEAVSGFGGREIQFSVGALFGGDWTWR